MKTRGPYKVKDNCRTLGQEHEWVPTKAGYGDRGAMNPDIKGWKRCVKCGWATAPALMEKAK